MLFRQVFSELQEIGKDIKEEVQDVGFPAHGDMGGDISKCPYYAAKMGEEVVSEKISKPFKNDIFTVMLSFVSV